MQYTDKERSAKYLEKAERSIRAAQLILDINCYPGFSASRSYFAMSYCVCALFEKNWSYFSSHEQLIDTFDRHFLQTEKLPKILGENLRKALALRLAGDYDPSMPVTAEDAQENLLRAKEFLAETERYLANLKN